MRLDTRNQYSDEALEIDPLCFAGRLLGKWRSLHSYSHAARALRERLEK